MRRILAIILLGALLAGCATLHYKRTQVGQLSGKVIVQWYRPDLFIYWPDTTDPLTFMRKNGDRLEPENMYTDGGSIPRVFWVLRNYSPWGYGPAFVVHDWLYHVRNCGLVGHKEYTYTLKDAATVMSEIMKTLMESPRFPYGSKTSMYLMYEAVQTAPAREAWEHGECKKPDPDHPRPVSPDATFVLDFTRRG
jgi:hypothetical protein